MEIQTSFYESRHLNHVQYNDMIYIRNEYSDSHEVHVINWTLNSKPIIGELKNKLEFEFQGEIRAFSNKEWQKGKRYGKNNPNDGTSGYSESVRIPFDKIAYCIETDDYYGFTKDKSYEVFWHLDGGIGSIKNDDDTWVISKDCWKLFISEEEYKKLKIR
jgi:hypothetical protein